MESVGEAALHLGVLAIAELAFTSFYAVFGPGVLGGWWLLAHMCGAGTFLGILPLLALTWARPCGFACCCSSGTEATQSERFPGLAKACFWLIVFGGILVSGTMLLSMMPWFGTDGLINLARLHGYAGLLIVVATIIHSYSVCLSRSRLS